MSNHRVLKTRRKTMGMCMVETRSSLPAAQVHPRDAPTRPPQPSRAPVFRKLVHILPCLQYCIQRHAKFDATETMVTCQSLRSSFLNRHRASSRPATCRLGVCRYYLLRTTYQETDLIVRTRLQLEGNLPSVLATSRGHMLLSRLMMQDASTIGIIICYTHSYIAQGVLSIYTFKVSPHPCLRCRQVSFISS